MEWGRFALILGSSIGILALKSSPQRLSDCTTCPLDCMCSLYCLSVTCNNINVSVLQDLHRDTRTLSVQNTSALVNLDTTTFPNLTSLKSLTLSHNGIAEIEFGSFENMPSLQFLYLDNNNISVIGNGAFNGPIALKSLDLSNNGLAHINRDMFSGLWVLESLSLANNSISLIDPGAFNRLGMLQSLITENNKLTSLDSTMFEGLASLNSLRLGGNLISEIGNGTFSGCPRLRKIWINSNKLSNLSPWIFQVSNAITYLSLSDNEFTDVPADVFPRLTSLVYLEFNGNPLLTVKSNAFSNLTSLRNLELNNMPKLTGFEPNALTGLTGLRMLNVENNDALTTFPATSFKPSSATALKVLCLSDNQIAVFDKDVFLKSTSLMVALVKGNPLKCDCNAKWMREAADAGYAWASSWKDARTSPACYTPVNLFGYQVKDVLPVDLTCDPPLEIATTPTRRTVNEGVSVNFEAILSRGFPNSVWITPKGVTLHPGHTDASASKNIRSVTEIRHFIPNAPSSVTASLTITNITKSAEGVYSLVAMSAGGATTTAFRLIINATEAKGLKPVVNVQAMLPPRVASLQSSAKVVDVQSSAKKFDMESPPRVANLLSSPNLAGLQIPSNEADLLSTQKLADVNTKTQISQPKGKDVEPKYKSKFEDVERQVKVQVTSDKVGSMTEDGSVSSNSLYPTVVVVTGCSFAIFIIVGFTVLRIKKRRNDYEKIPS